VVAGHLEKRIGEQFWAFGQAAFEKAAAAVCLVSVNFRSNRAVFGTEKVSTLFDPKELSASLPSL
jgi:hypothetical protein